MIKQKTVRKKKSFFEMTPAERARDVARFDKESLDDYGARPMTAEEQAVFDRWRGGTKKSVYSVGIDREMFEAAFKASKRNRESMRTFVERAIRGLIAFER